MDHMLKEAGIDAGGLSLDDIDQSLYTPISGLDSKQATIASLGDGVDDMINMDDLDEMTIMRNLSVRYSKDVIYTYIGAILVAVNSFKKINGLYDRPDFFKRKALSQVPPHIFALSEKAYSALIATGNNQAFVISGESGAGKTESMKLICRYMAHVDSGAQSEVQAAVLNVNVLLEAFGNAKTVYNNNSSRFGKFTELQFNDSGVLAGARVCEYLLEKSRLVRQAPKERNYHVFYYILAGASKEERDAYILTDIAPTSYHYLNQSGCITINGLDDAKCFGELKASMTMFSPPQIFSIFQIVAGLLHLGNIEFDVDATGENVTGISTKSTNALNAAATVLGVAPQVLGKPLITRTSFIRGEYITSPLTRDKAADSRDALAKAVYGRLFNYIIRNVNSAICVTKSERFIGVLDIFGFENFGQNSFEQFCINFANEQLQDFFNEYIFKLEQLEYKHEGLKLSEITFVDNKPCLDMIKEKNTGLLDTLDEQSYFPKATTESLLQRFNENCKGHANYEKDRVSNKYSFAIKHYAGLVMYDASGFLEKNRDTIFADLLDAALSSDLAIIQEIFSMSATSVKPGKGREDSTVKRKVLTVSSEFKLSLDDLMVALRKTQPYFIRCVKPNQQQVPNTFVDEFVLKQLRYSGMLETVRIRREGYPVRYTFDDFFNRFSLLVNPEERKGLANKDNKKSSAALVAAIKLSQNDFQFGKTKVFIRDKPAALLESRLAQIQAQRLALLKAEIERKRKEEEERKKREEEERKKKEEEERKKREEMERIAAEKAAIEAAKAAVEEEERRKIAEAAAAARAAITQTTGAPPPPAAPAAPAPGKLKVDPKIVESLIESTGPPPPPPPPAPIKAPEVPQILDVPPPPIPAGSLTREQVEAKLAGNPGWMEERQLKKLFELYKKHEIYEERKRARLQDENKEEEEIMKLPPWKRELMKKRNAEKAASDPVKIEEPSNKKTTKPRSNTLSFAQPNGDPAPRVASIGGGIIKPEQLKELQGGASTLQAPSPRLGSDVRKSNRTESAFYSDSPLQSPRASSLPTTPTAHDNNEAPVIPPGTPSRAECEAKLAANPGWIEEKELKKTLALYKAVDEFNNRQNAARDKELRKQREEEAKLAAMPPWKRQQIEKKMAEERAEKAAAEQQEAARQFAAEEQERQAAAAAFAAEQAANAPAVPSPPPSAPHSPKSVPHSPKTPAVRRRTSSVSVPPPSFIAASPAPPPPPPAAVVPASPPLPPATRQPVAAPSKTAANVTINVPAYVPANAAPAPTPAAAAPPKAAAKGAAAAAPAPAPAAAPAASDWKANLLEKKRKEAEEKLRLEEEKKAAELAKLPAWKRAIAEKK